VWSAPVMDRVGAPTWGSTPDAIVISAHHDTIHDSLGADDNTASVAALLELARIASGAQGGKPTDHPPKAWRAFVDGGWRRPSTMPIPSVGQRLTRCPDRQLSADDQRRGGVQARSPSRRFFRSALSWPPAARTSAGQQHDPTLRSWHTGQVNRMSGCWCPTFVGSSHNYVDARSRSTVSSLRSESPTDRAVDSRSLTRVVWFTHCLTRSQRKLVKSSACCCPSP
jgi:Peptidase family M28